MPSPTEVARAELARLNRMVLDDQLPTEGALWFLIGQFEDAVKKILVPCEKMRQTMVALANTAARECTDCEYRQIADSAERAMEDDLRPKIARIVAKVAEAERMGGGFRLYFETATTELLELLSGALDEKTPA